MAVEVKQGQQEKGKTEEELKEKQRKREPELGVYFYAPPNGRACWDHGRRGLRSAEGADAEVVTG